MASMKPPSIIVLAEAALKTAKRISNLYPEAEIFGRTGRVSSGIPFDDTGALLRQLFAEDRPILGICAAGILIRLLAKELSSKTNEPPVLALSEDGQVVVPLLGGHNGANQMAAKIAGLLGGDAALTTATDRRYGVALDDPPNGWFLSNPEDAKPFFAALLAGETICLLGKADWLTGSNLPIGPDGDLTIQVTETVQAGNAKHLVYHRQNLTLGIGCERGASSEEISHLVTETLTANRLHPGAVAGIWSIDVKMDEPGIAEVAQSLKVPLRFFPPETLEAETPRLANPSELVFREVGAHSVAEAAALAAAGPASALIVPKAKSLRATCAIAHTVEPIQATMGIARGHLTLVGLGPGSPEWRTAECMTVLRQAEEIVGFQMYIDLIDDLDLTAHKHAFKIGAESERVRTALDLAMQGRRVALICSGDAGIYAMAALTYEIVDESPRVDWRRLDITVAPGISALQGAAARIGAPLGHDFCTISLSDLLTPWQVIENRIRAAADGDFVVAFYNPVSRRRNTQLPAARDILLNARPADTPVVLARNLGRADESNDVITLGGLTTETVDMTTVVLVGSSETRRIDRRDGGVWVYTPRGYGTKNSKDNQA
jgi:cobalt-precorrin 5A hydrolase/precorrin-3B C17-methyltransferase